MNSGGNDVASSPLSEAPPKKLRALPKSFLLAELEAYYGAKPPPDIVECDYSLWQCAETQLQFCWPLVPGNVAFYEWISGFDSYYPGVRWEYRELRRQLSAEHAGAREFTVMDVGCGKGDFLNCLDFMPNNHKYALDLNSPAIEACRKQGFNVFCGTVEAALEKGFLRPAQLSIITAFHCLEHVPDPVGFARELLKALAPGGRLYVSTPYSPMSFESDWFDVMNHPPHHMTRWNLKAYQRLAEKLGAKMRHFVPPFYPAKNALNIFRLKQYGPHRSAGRLALLKDLLRHWSLYRRLCREQQERARTSPVGGSDVILVEFTIA